MPLENHSSEAVQNYLKAICRICQTPGGPSRASPSRSVSAPRGSARCCATSPSTIWWLYTPYQPVRLTELGRADGPGSDPPPPPAGSVSDQSLGYGWDQVHTEAERLEHHISEEFEESIERLLGYPAFDPHGDPIPTRDGRLPPPVTETMDAQADGARLVVRRVTDEDGDLLRYLGERGLRPGVVLLVVDREPSGGPLRLEIDGRRCA